MYFCHIIKWHIVGTRVRIQSHKSWSRQQLKLVTLQAQQFIYIMGTVRLLVVAFSIYSILRIACNVLKIYHRLWCGVFVLREFCYYILVHSHSCTVHIIIRSTHYITYVAPYIANKLYGKINLKLVQLQRHLPTPPSAQIYGITFIWYNENDSHKLSAMRIHFIFRYTELALRQIKCIQFHNIN